MTTHNMRGAIIHRAELAFFQAMLAGYAGDGKGVVREVTPDGHKTLTWENEEFRIVDRYCVAEDCRSSAGTTTIFFNGMPIWWMAYAGQYTKSAIPFLKKALAHAYTKGEFHGGRGPIRFQDGSMTYRNHQGNSGFSFGSFDGFEQIIAEDAVEALGYHKYFGMLLI